jgi:hypothetical protein
MRGFGGLDVLLGLLPAGRGNVKWFGKSFRVVSALVEAPVRHGC